MGSSRVVLSRSTSTWVQLVPSLTSPSTLCIIPATCWMTEKPSRYVVLFHISTLVKKKKKNSLRIFIKSQQLLPPPDLHLLCVGDGRGCQRPVVRPDDIRDHGRHASRRAVVRIGSGHRPVVEPRSLCQAV